MKVLIVSATKNEIQGLMAYYDAQMQDAYLSRSKVENKTLDFLITGVGQVATCSRLTRHIYSDKYDMVFQVGIAGSYNDSLDIGTVVSVREEEQVDFGLKSKAHILSATDISLLKENEYPYQNNVLINNSEWLFDQILLPQVKGATVNTLYTDKQDIKMIRDKYYPDIETMEGAAFFYVMKLTEIPFYQIRSISNRVGERDKQKWDIPLAIYKLELVVKSVLDNL